MTFSNDGCAAGLHRNPHPGGIDSEEGAAIFAGEDATGFNRLAAPTIKAEDSIGLRDRVPALNVEEFAPMGFACADVSMIEVTSAGLSPVLLRSPSPCPHAQNWLWVGEGDTGNFRALFEVIR